MPRFTASDNRCNTCINSQVVVSENDHYYVCCLSDKQILDCLMGANNHYIDIKDVCKKLPQAKEKTIPKYTYNKGE